MAEKKELAENIKKLSFDHMQEVANIIYEGKPPTSEEVNLENLASKKIR